MSKYNSLHKKWIAENMPELAERLGPLDTNGVRLVLNEVTGLDIPSYAVICDSMELFMARLKEMKQ